MNESRSSAPVKNALKSARFRLIPRSVIRSWDRGNFTREVLGIDPNTCKNDLTGDCLNFTYLFAWLIIVLLLFPGIIASNYSHVKYFPSRAAYDAFYEIILRVVNIASEDFAAYAQFSVVRYLRSVSDETANWFEEWWAGARG